MDDDRVPGFAGASRGDADACRVCGSREDLRCGVCFECASNKERELCAGERGCEFDDRPGTAFYDRCVWCDLPRGLAKHFTESHGPQTRSSLAAATEPSGEAHHPSSPQTPQGEQK
jgi:hypothetical protein